CEAQSFRQLESGQLGAQFILANFFPHKIPCVTFVAECYQRFAAAPDNIHTKTEIAVAILVVVDSPFFHPVLLCEIIFWPESPDLLRFENERDQFTTCKFPGNVVDLVTDVRSIPFPCLAGKMARNS